MLRVYACSWRPDLKVNVMEFTIKEVPFSWNDNFSEIALEDFSMIQKELPYCICQSIGMALAKLELLEKQGCKVEEMEDEQSGSEEDFTERLRNTDRE